MLTNLLGAIELFLYSGIPQHLFCNFSYKKFIISCTVPSLNIDAVQVMLDPDVTISCKTNVFFFELADLYLHYGNLSALFETGIFFGLAVTKPPLKFEIFLPG